ncbi:hypothetical protein [Nonomuraea dietziae]|uniref:hypothetical protein n=1 Tax=Nonomuraea dietziae TaxID=65515 RepID=UPI0031E31C20
MLGEPPAPEGTWEREAVYLSAAALRRRIAPGDLAAEVRALAGVVAVEVGGNGFLRITVDTPGDLLDDPHRAGGLPRPVAGPAPHVGQPRLRRQIRARQSRGRPALAPAS